MAKAATETTLPIGQPTLTERSLEDRTYFALNVDKDKDKDKDKDRGQYTLTVNVSPPGAGSVTKNPNKASYKPGDSVQLTAKASSGYTFTSWSGASGPSNPVWITMDGNKTVTANFKHQEYTLTVNIAPPGGGSVTKDPDKQRYDHGEIVWLTETAKPGYCFSQWTGGASGSKNPVKITIDRDTTVTAHFKKKKCKKKPDDCED